MTIYNVENAILTGAVIERQKDRETSEAKRFMSDKEKSKVCEVCGTAQTQIKYVTRSYGKGANLLIIENVPVISCANCSETYLTAETMHKIARIKMHRESFAKKRNVAVAEFV